MRDINQFYNDELDNDFFGSDRHFHDVVFEIANERGWIEFSEAEGFQWSGDMYDQWDDGEWTRNDGKFKELLGLALAQSA